MGNKSSADQTRLPGMDQETAEAAAKVTEWRLKNAGITNYKLSAVKLPIGTGWSVVVYCGDTVWSKIDAELKDCGYAIDYYTPAMLKAFDFWPRQKIRLPPLKLR